MPKKIGVISWVQQELARFKTRARIRHVQAHPASGLQNSAVDVQTGRHLTTHATTSIHMVPCAKGPFIGHQGKDGGGASPSIEILSSLSFSFTQIFFSFLFFALCPTLHSTHTQKTKQTTCTFKSIKTQTMSKLSPCINKLCNLKKSD
jgi:hypothetical protein